MASQALVPLPPRGAIQARSAVRRTPALFAETAQEQERLWEFFGGRIWNRNIHLAYVTAASRFADWGEGRGLRLARVRPLPLTASIEELTHASSAAPVKQRG